jgi:hypothetical protein
MNTHNPIATLFLVSLFCVPGASVQAFVEPQPSRVLEPVLESGSIQGAAARNTSSTVSTFASAYLRANKPRIAVFWNRQFDDQLSEWEPVRRRRSVIETESAYRAAAERNGLDDMRSRWGTSATDGVPFGRSENPLREWGMEGSSRVVASEYEEIRGLAKSESGAQDGENVEFAAGFVHTLVESGTRIIDRNTIMRLVSNAQARTVGSDISRDYQNVETEALLSYADYLAEVVLLPGSAHSRNPSFMVSVKEVSTGTVVAMFTSDGQTEVKGEEKWVATSNGYELIRDEVAAPTIREMAETLAHETMTALTRVWSL